MKVFQLLETNEWENDPIDPKTYLRDFRKRRQSIEHHKEILFSKIKAIEPGFDDTFFSPWRINSLDVNDFQEKIQKYIVQLKKLHARSELLSIEEIKAKVNMKYAQHNAELAFRHAKSVRNGPYPEGEDAIAKDPELAARYGLEILRKRFPKGEPAIKEALKTFDSSNPAWSYLIQYHAKFM